MRLSCPSCKTTFEIPAKKASVGKKVRCARCSTVFRIPTQASDDLTEEPAAAEARGSQRAWGEPKIDVTAQVDPPAGPLAEPFGGVSKPEPEPEPEPRAQATAGVSAIRAQSGATAPEQAIEDLRGAWILRLPDGGLRNFDSIEEVHAYLEANPDPGAEVSSDGKAWQPLASLRAMQASRSPVREPTGLSVALRAAASITPPEPAPSGVAWPLAALLSTLLMLGSVALTLQTLDLVDISGWVPFEALGLSAIARSRREDLPLKGAPEDPERATRRSYRELMERAARARTSGRLIDAALAYQHAVDTLESPEALEALAGVFETLGETGRARKVRTRLSALREKRGQRTP